jgi:dihydrodipicolinate synthase/N-acetylneuraminate lyase
VGIYTAWQAKDYAKALELQTKLAPVRRLFTVGSHPGGLKEAMVGTPEGMHACQDYGKAVGKKL